MPESCNSTVPILGLPVHALFPSERFHIEEERAGPADTNDLLRYLRERAESVTVEVKSHRPHRHTMRDSVPFSNQDGSRLQPSSGWLSQWTPFRPIPAPALERAASGTFEAADCFFSQSVPEHLDQQVATNPARSIRSEQVAPGLVQLFSAEV